MPSSVAMRCTSAFSAASSAAMRACSAFSAASSPAATLVEGSPSSSGPARGPATSPHSNWAQRGSRAPGARGQLHHPRRLLGRHLVQEAFHRRDVGKAVQPLAVQAQFGRCLRAAQHQQREQRHRGRRQAQHAAHVVLEAHHAAAAAFEDQAQLLQAVHRGQHLRIGGIDDRLARGLLVAAGHQRVQRQRISVRHRVLLFHQHRQHAGFQRRQRPQLRLRSRRLRRSPRH